MIMTRTLLDVSTIFFQFLSNLLLVDVRDIPHGAQDSNTSTGE